MNIYFNQKSLIIIIAVLVLIILGYYALNMPDRRDPAEKIGDAIQELGDQTTGEKIKDALQDGDTKAR